MTPEQDFKLRFAELLKDLRNEGSRDGEAMWLVGSLATALMVKAKASSWPTFKLALSRDAYDGLLRDFREQGNAFARERKRKHAYAIQILAMSVIARTQLDEDMRAGEALLDQVVDHALSIFQKSRGQWSASV